MINWKQNQVAFHDEFCLANCILHSSSHSTSFISILSPENLDTNLEKQYKASCPPDSCTSDSCVFSDAHVSSLCSIDIPVHPILSLDIILPDDLDSPEPILDDYHICHFFPDFCVHHHTTPSLSCNSLNLSCQASTVDPVISSTSDSVAPVLPDAYAEFLPLFQDRPAGTLPPHQPYDHVITLEPDAKPPFGPLYTLSQKELEALCKYIDDNLAKGFICHSESPAGAPVLFVPKKGGEL